MNLSCYKKIIFWCLLCMFVILIFINEIDDIFGGENDANGRKIRYIYFKGGQFSFWTVSHILFFMFLGYICPKNILLICFIGIIWELLELYFEYDRQTLRTPFLCRYINNCHVGEKIPKSKFWDLYVGNTKGHTYRLFYCSAGLYGQISDICANIIGALVGSGLSKIMFNIK